ncbi:VWA domain-containing protein [Sphingopyxis sp. BSNA05]|uniref:vWA domain-containing protein n=1 Tax=Sphingopyxis sp. BSNA05 TaxID=1236614 RepID=UPI0015641CF0|nr:VWA domain-containing protein [Sphingopyxis sp. BSNA05]
MDSFSKFATWFVIASFAILPERPQAQVLQEEDDYNVIVVTSARQGGAQDARRFRKAAEDGMPRPEMLTIEGLMGEHDLTLPATGKCEQMFCLVTEAMPASISGRPDDKIFVGLSFATNIDEALYKRPPLNLVAVVDKSRSMSGEPLELVRQSLRRIVSQMQDDDQLSIVLYGDESHVWMNPTKLKQNRRAILSKVNAIESAGSTNMEAGLKVGYDTAFDSQKGFPGSTRVMLFTDENANVGDTSAEGFMGMAIAASQRDVGLTTIGVGVIFDDSLATKLSSVRGGNLFFIEDQAAVEDVFSKQFELMSGEFAHDLKLTIVPANGWTATGVFGVPDSLMTSGRDGAIAVTIPTVFLSNNGGGIYVTLGKSSERANLPVAAIDEDGWLMNVSLSYAEAQSGKAGTDQLTVAPPGAVASAPLRLSQNLVDQFLHMQSATTAYHIDNDPKRAFSILSDLENRLKDASLASLDSELKLVGNMRAEAAYYAGYSGELPENIRHRAISGRWKVVRATGFVDVFKGNIMTFETEEDDKGYVQTERVKPPRGVEESETEEFAVNEKQIFFKDSDIIFGWRLVGDRLYLKDRAVGSNARINLQRIETDAEAASRRRILKGVQYFQTVKAGYGASSWCQGTPSLRQSARNV